MVIWDANKIVKLRDLVQSRDHDVFFHGNRVYGIEIPPSHIDIRESAVYLQEYEDCPPDEFYIIQETTPDDFDVFSRIPLKWYE